jgi:hypothetical protein
MSDPIDKLCADLNARLNALDASVRRVKASIAAAPAKAERAFRINLDQAEARIGERQTLTKDSQARRKSKLKQDIAEAKDKIEKWKANHEAERLARYADNADEYAAYAILDALSAVDDAEVVALEAIQARLDAEVAASAASAMKTGEHLATASNSTYSIQIR